MQLYIEPDIFFFGSVVLLMLPLDWLLAALLAAIIHELCHMAAVVLLGGTVSEISIGVGGARIKAVIPGSREEVLAVLAGPAGSLLLLLLLHCLPQLAICGCVQSLFNLLPIPSLDGGRILKALLQNLWPEYAESLLVLAEIIVIAGLLLAAVYAARVLSAGIWPVMMILILISGRFR